MTRLIPVLLLAGCPWIGPETHNDNFPNEGTNGVSEITLTSIDPAVGPTGLLTDVVLTGEGFEPDEAENYAVSVRGLDITDLQVTSTTVSFTMPALATAGPVDVVFVEFDDDEDETLETSIVEGFEYFPNRARFTGLFGTAENLRFVNTEWPFRQDNGGRIYMALLEPTVAISAVEQYARGPNQCRNSYFVPGLVGLDVADDTIRLENASGAEVLLQRIEEGRSDYDTVSGPPISNADMRSTFDLLTIEGGENLPPFDVTDLFDMPPEVSLNTQSVSIGGGTTTENSFLFSWEHDDTSTDYIVITLDIYDSNWSTYRESVYCVVDDNGGQFRIPSGTISNWTDGDMMNVQVGRMRTVDNILPHDASGVVFPALNWSAGFIEQRR